MKDIWTRIKLPTLVIVPGLIAIFALANLKPKPKPDLSDMKDPPLLRIDVKQADAGIASLSVTTQGTVAPKREIDIVAQVSGQVQKVETNFVDGGFFAEQELLLQIEDRDYQAAFLAAKARLAEAEQGLAEERGKARQAKREWRDLGNKDANSLFLRKPQLAAAEANVASQKAELAKAELNLERTRIRVPFNGRIRETFVNLGQYVTPGTRIATVYDSSVAEIRLPLSDRQAALVDLPIGFAAKDSESAPKVKITGVIGGEERTWTGYITRTDASIDVSSRMVFAVAEVTNPYKAGENLNNEYPLVVGLFVEAEIEGKQLEDVIILPRKAVFNRDQIYIVDEENSIQKKHVNVLHKTNEHAWIRADLPEAERIVLGKQALVSPGTIVDPQNIDDSNKTLTADTNPAQPAATASPAKE